MNRKRPTIICAVLLAGILTACGSTTAATVSVGMTGSDVIGSGNASYTKPSSITIMVDGTLVTQENGRRL